MPNLILPEPIAAYFASEHSPEALAHCFTAQAVMTDFVHTYTGMNAIKTLMAEASLKYSATTVPLTIEREDGLQIVRANVSGNFVGSPTVLSYRFRLERGLIASLEVTA